MLRPEDTATPARRATQAVQILLAIGPVDRYGGRAGALTRTVTRTTVAE
jgi:hypothetical protein